LWASPPPAVAPAAISDESSTFGLDESSGKQYLTLRQPSRSPRPRRPASLGPPWSLEES
jgi:hypothetical protein